MWWRVSPLRQNVRLSDWRACRNLNSLNVLWLAILQEAERYTEEAIAQIEAIWQQRYTDLSSS